MEDCRVGSMHSELDKPFPDLRGEACIWSDWDCSRRKCIHQDTSIEDRESLADELGGCPGITGIVEPQAPFDAINSPWVDMAMKVPVVRTNLDMSSTQDLSR